MADTGIKVNRTTKPCFTTGVLQGRAETHLPHRERLFVCVSEVWSGVVVGSGVIEARLDDPIGRWGGAGSDADALLPEAEVAQDAFDHG